MVYKKIKSSKEAKAVKKKERDHYPSCNIEYVQEHQRSRVWCSTLRLNMRVINWF